MNDDIQEIRRLLAPANPSPRGALAGAGKDAIGRTAFNHITRAESVRRGFLSRRATVRLVTIGGLALALAAGTTVAQDLAPAGPVANAQVVLNQAANVAQQRTFTAPRPEQWVYTETQYKRLGKPGKGEVLTAESPLRTELDRLWIRADGKRLATLVDGKVEVSPTGGGVPPVDYASVAALPRDPDKLLAWARENGGPIAEPDVRPYNVLFGLMLSNGVLPPDLEAATYRALALIPGIEVDEAAVDDTDRPVVSISIVVEGYLKQEILLDRTTYAYRGHRTTVIKDHTFPEGGTYKAGAVESYSVRLTTGIVDRSGQRP
ncbi:CU044_5270 family protein [Nonomuraea guangzhouensis]|uniref:CU044_5270 family protein n=1 Tax=Nonomuraea guangzhouensis TaxID=1291555 RepID=A0ABW4GZ87_9ACTN|nr:CU044_5270 family protein [Nonomuraea guangzhouensis]